MTKEDLSVNPSYGTDHNKEVPASERTGSGAYSMAMLCKQDKEQLDRIENMLKSIYDGLPSRFPDL